jgi:hypothetical protein
VRDGLLAGDGDELCFIREVERLFGVAFTDDELMASRTMGDIEAAVARHLAAKNPAQNRCMSALAFYALRRVLDGGGQKLSPATPVVSWMAAPRMISARVAERTGMTLSFPLGSIGRWGVLFTLAGLVVACGGLITRSLPILLSGVLTLIGGFGAIRVDQGDFSHMQNAGAVARELARQNPGHFIAQGARFTPDEVWRRLQEIAVDEVGGRAEEITRETLLIQPAKTWFQAFRSK